MWVRLIGFILIVVGFSLAYVGWREISKIDEIDDQIEWEDAAYGSRGQVAEFLVIGSFLILVGALLTLRLL
jgi:hypothetical protein